MIPWQNIFTLKLTGIWGGRGMRWQM